MKAIGIDFYNLRSTGGVAMSIRATRDDNEHIPCVLMLNSSGGGIAGTIDSSYYKGQGLLWQGIEREYIVIYESDSDSEKRNHPKDQNGRNDVYSNE